MTLAVGGSLNPNQPTIRTVFTKVSMVFSKSCVAIAYRVNPYICTGFMQTETPSVSTGRVVHRKDVHMMLSINGDIVCNS